LAEEVGGLKAKVGLDTVEFNAGIAELSKKMQIVSQDFKNASGSLDKVGDASKISALKMEELSKKIELQKSIVDQFKEAHERVTAEFGEGSKKALDYELKLKKAEGTLQTLENALKSTTTEVKDESQAINKAGDETSTTDKKTDGLAKAMDRLKAASSAVASGMKFAVAGVAAMGAATVAAGAGMLKLVNSSADYADGVQKSADVTGLSAERVQELTYAGGVLGVEFDTIAGAQAKLTKSMTAAEKGTGSQAEAFRKLRIDATDGNGALRDSKVVMQEALTALNGVGNETERDSLAMQLFGKSAMELNPLIKAGGVELSKLTAEANKNGAVLSGKQIAALDNFGDSVGSLKLSLQGLGANMSTALLPALSGMVTNIQNISNEIGKAVKTGDWSSVGVAISDGLNSVISQISGMLPGMSKMAADIIGGLVGAIVMALPQVLPSLIDSGIQLINAIVQTFGDNGPTLIKAGLDALMTLIKGIVDSLPQMIDTAIILIMSLANGIIDNLPKLVDATVKLIVSLVDGIIILLPQLIPAAIKAIVVLAQGLIDALPKLIEKLPEIIKTIVKILVENFPLLVDASLKIIVAITTALIDNLPLIINSSIEIIGALAGGLIDNFFTVCATIPKLFDDLVKAFSNINWKQLGIDLINGIIDGVKSAAVGLANSVTKAADDALKSAKAFLGIKSPSTVMRDQVGLMMGAGMAEGVTRSKGMLTNAITGLSSVAVGAAQTQSINNISRSNTGITIINQGTIVGSRGMEEFSNTVSISIGKKLGLSMGGKY